MKKLLTTFSVLMAVVILMSTAYSQAFAAPGVTITLLNPPEDPLVLGVGESYTFDILIESSEPFIVALAMTNAYYPGRGVYWHGSDRATHATSATLHLTLTGKKPTAELAGVCDWPEPRAGCWPDGVAPVAIAAGVRFKGGLVDAEQFSFAVEVP
jgi:hypothetical protein